MLPKTIVLLLSGGLDSVVLLYDMLSDGDGLKVHCALFDYKQRHVQELEWAKTHCQRMNVLWTTIELPQLRGSELTDGSGGVIVPNRNAIMLSHAVNLAVAAKAESVAIACNKDDAANFPDCREWFIASYNHMLIGTSIPVEITAPYINRSKAWIAARGRDLGVKFSETWSCYRGGIQPCGKCLACLKRNDALRANQLEQSLR